MIRKIKDSKNNIHRTQAFTLIEVMIAISVFAMLLLYASQFMRSEINVFNSATRQNEVEQKARIAMMQIIDEVRLSNLTFYQSISDIPGIYRYQNVAKAASKDISGATNLIYIRLLPTQVTLPSLPPSTKVFFDYETGKLWYIKDGSTHLIADEISELSITPDGTHLAKIDLKVGGTNGSQPYELLTWVRLN